MVLRRRHILAGILVLCGMLVPAVVRAVDMAAPAVQAVPESLSPENIQKRFQGPNCKLEKQCGGLAYINCDSEMDGPAYYVKSDSLEVVMICGGACEKPESMRTDGKDCAQCPPKEWTCQGAGE